jgi:DNA-binding MarR family transcriptional regulator
MRDAAQVTRPLGDLLQDFIARVAHRSGRTLTIMNAASVTLHQVILLGRLMESGQATVSELATVLGMSLSSVSQMVDRLHRLDLLTRAEMSDDRRKKQIELTQKGRALLHRLSEARAMEFEIGLAPLPAPLQAELADLLARALLELDRRTPAQPAGKVREQAAPG